jgi:putative oxidoreductase
MNKEFRSNAVLLVLRAVVGINMACLHGWEKLHHFSSKAGSFPDPFGMGHKYALMVAVAGEFIGGILLATGLLGRVGAFLVSLAVGLTLFSTLRSAPWQDREVWALYFAASLTVLILGCGRFSLDTVVWKKLGKGGGAKAPQPARK